MKYAEPLGDTTSYATLSFRFLGSFAFHGVSRWRAAPARAHGGEFLAYLATHPGCAVSRHTLADVLWPDLDTQQSTHRLHIAVSGARAAVRTEVPHLNPILFVEGSYAWNASLVIRSDTEQLERCFNEGSLDAHMNGVAIYKGQFLSGDDADWILPLRVRYEHMYVTMLEHLAEDALSSANYPVATNFGMELVAVDRANERATQLIMLASAKGGHRSVALVEFERLERYLKRWLGVEPMAETQRLRRQILRGEIGPTAATQG